MTAMLSERFARAKAAYTTHLVRPESMSTLLTGLDLAPRAGDLVLARVERIGQHKSLEGPDGRKSTLFCGDDVVVVYGNRYAPDQFEAEVPSDLSPCELVAAGGLAARSLSSHVKMKAATVLQPLGLVADRDGRRLNLADWRLPAPIGVDARPPTIAVVGTAMNAGKTTAAAFLVNGLVAAGFSVGAAKVTGTGAGGDVWMMADAGASPVLDFTHGGCPSTYHCPVEEVRQILLTLTGHLAAAGVDVVVLEVADGVFQAETAALLADPAFAEAVDGIVFAASDALGAVAGVECLRALDHAVVAVSGLLTASPLATREARSALNGLVVVDPVELSHPAVAELLLAEVGATRPEATSAPAPLLASP